MTDQNLFVLVSIMENALMGHWSFRAKDELAVAHHLLRHAWDYDKVFWALRISLREVDQITPENLLQAIHDSYPNQRVRAVLYLLRVTEPAQCSEPEPLENAAGATESC